MWYPLSLHLSRHPLVRPPPRLLRAQSPWSPRALSDVFHRTCSTTFCVIRPTLESTLRSTCYRANDSTSPLPPIRPDYFIFSGRHTVCACVLHVQCPGTATTNLTTRYVSIDSHPRTTLLKVHIPYSCGISPISRDTTRLVWHFLRCMTSFWPSRTVWVLLTCAIGCSCPNPVSLRSSTSWWGLPSVPSYLCSSPWFAS